jgi:hypothetical protein
MFTIYGQHFLIPNHEIILKLDPEIKVDCFHLAYCIVDLYEENLRIEDLGKIISCEEKFDGSNFADYLLLYQDLQSKAIDQDKYFGICRFLIEKEKIILPKQERLRIPTIKNGTEIYTRACWYGENLDKINRENI